MNVETRKAYEWAMSQNYGSVAAQYAKLLALELQRYIVPRPESEWHEDMGPVLWWKKPESEHGEIRYPFFETQLWVGWDSETPYAPTHFTEVSVVDVSEWENTLDGVTTEGGPADEAR